ncbi:acyltransferase family protein [Alkalicoccus luteus]|uniref:acyltransferase family protein n=1 Tax=Alkalicoccus luteus TaxID=1237094 RepID=UPI00403480A4
MRQSPVLYEAYWLRTIACLAVMMTHTVDVTLLHYENQIGWLEENLLILMRFMAYFGTPAFVFLSEFLIARAYREQVPASFLRKRVRYLLIPFAVMGVVFAVALAPSWSAVPDRAALHILAGGYTGYFVLIIFQFYLLHLLAARWLNCRKPWPVLGCSLVISALYLLFFNLTEPPAGAVAEYIWQRGYWLPFIGWLFYFTLGFYAGIYYDQLKQRLDEHRWLIRILPVFSILLLIVLVRTDTILVVSSKRIDMLLYTTAMIFLIFYLARFTEKAPPPVLWISRYSFNIYLLHNLFLLHAPPIPGLPPLVYAATALTAALLLSITAAAILAKLPGSDYIIGKQLPVPHDKAAKKERLRPQGRTVSR